MCVCVWMSGGIFVFALVYTIFVFRQNCSRRRLRMCACVFMNRRRYISAFVHKHAGWTTFLTCVCVCA